MTAVVGAAQTGSSAVLVTLASASELLDRRSVELVDAGLSLHPHHHEGSWAVGRFLKSPWARQVALEQALALVQRVRACAERRARTQLAKLDKLVLVGARPDKRLLELGRSAGSPWQALHKLAATAALAALLAPASPRAKSRR